MVKLKSLQKLEKKNQRILCAYKSRCTCFIFFFNLSSRASVDLHKCILTQMYALRFIIYSLFRYDRIYYFISLISFSLQCNIHSNVCARNLRFRIYLRIFNGLFCDTPSRPLILPPPSVAQLPPSLRSCTSECAIVFKQNLVECGTKRHTRRGCLCI